MAKSSLTEGLKSSRVRGLPPSAQLPPSWSINVQRRGYEPNQLAPSPAAHASRDSSEACTELSAIFSQGLVLQRSKSTSSFGSSPPERSDNGIIRDRCFGRCANIPTSATNTESAASKA